MSIMAETIKAARARSEGYRRKSSETVAAGGGPSGVGALAKSANLAHHAEQYRHFQGWTYAVIRTIAQRIAGQPIRVARTIPGDEVRRLDSNLLTTKDGRRLLQPRPRLLPGIFKGLHGRMEVLQDHAICRLFNNPNPLMVQWTLMYSTFCSLELTGRAYLWVTPEDVDDPDSPLHLYPLPSSWVEPIHEDERLFTQWRVRPATAAEEILVPGNAICQLYYPDPANPLNAIAPLQAMARAVITDEAISEAQRRSFANGIFPGHAVIIGRHPDAKGLGADPTQRPMLTKEQRGQITAALKQAYRGVQNEGEPIILDALIEDVKPISTSPKEMAYMESGNMTKERITQGWGVNPISMGQVEGANRASSAVADDHLCGNVINPRLELVSQILTRWLPPFFGASPDELCVYIEAAHSYDADLERADEALLLGQGAMTRNELRSRHGLPPIQDGDSVFVPGMGEIFLVPAEEGSDAAASQTASAVRYYHR